MNKFIQSLSNLETLVLVLIWLTLCTGAGVALALLSAKVLG